MKKSFLIFSASMLSISLWATTHVVQPTSPNATDNIRRTVRGDYGVQDGDTLLLVTGDYYETSSIAFQAKSNLVLMAAEGEKPVVHPSSYTKIYVPTTIEGIRFNGDQSSEYTFYIYETNAQKFTLKNCEIFGFSTANKYNIYCSGSSTHIDEVVIDGCFFHDNASAAAYFPASSLADNVPACSKLTVKNTTACNIANATDVSVFDIRNNGSDKTGTGTTLIVDHVTVYNYTSGNGAIMSYKSPNVTISNSVIMNPTATEQYSTYCYGGTISNTIIYNTHSHHSGPTTVACQTTDPLFTDAANMDFSFQAGSPAINAATDGTNLGDPRWSKSKEDDDEPITIVIDGNAADWANVPMLTQPGTYPIIRAIPASGFAANTLSMYYMYEDTATFNSGDFPHLYVDADSNPDTGTKLGNAYVNFGYDYNFTSGYEDPTWISFQMSTSDHVMEIAIDKAAMPTAVVPFNAQFRWRNSDWTEYWRFPQMPSEYGWSFGESAYHVATIKNFHIENIEGTHTAENSYARFAYMPTSNPADFGANSTSKDTLAWISWPVRISKSGIYTITADIESDNGVSCDLYLYDMASNQLVKKYISGQKTITGSWEVGNWDLSNVSEGKYMLVMKNHVAHSHMKLHSVTLTYAGGAVMSIPGQLPSEEAMLAGDMIRLDNGSIQWPNKSDIDSHYATWNVTAAAAGDVDVYIYIGTPSSGHCFTVALYDGETLKSSVSEDETKHTTGEVKLEPSITIPAAGSYTIRLTNATQWSSAIVDSIVVKAAEAPAEIIISENATDNSLLTANLNKTINVTLERSMPTGMFSTFCLPFNLSSSQIANSPFAGSEIYYLDSTALHGDEVVLYFKPNSDFYHGVPYLVMPATPINNPSFEGVTIKDDEAATTTSKNYYACFRGTFITKHLEAGNENLLYLGANNTLYFPPSGDTESMKGLRGYFEVLQTAGAPIRRASIHMGSNVVTTFDLIDGEVIPHGLFMLNGQIEIRVNGQKYLLNGMQK